MKKRTKSPKGFMQKHNERIEENSDTDMFVVCKVAQLTGFSDPVYAEAYVNVNQYDIVLDLLIVNQTSDTLQNVTLELATLGERAYVLQVGNLEILFQQPKGG